jgi:hypothetical protein
MQTVCKSELPPQKTQAQKSRLRELGIDDDQDPEYESDRTASHPWHRKLKKKDALGRRSCSFNLYPELFVRIFGLNCKRPQLLLDCTQLSRRPTLRPHFAALHAKCIQPLAKPTTRFRTLSLNVTCY